MNNDRQLLCDLAKEIKEDVKCNLRTERQLHEVKSKAKAFNKICTALDRIDHWNMPVEIKELKHHRVWNMIEEVLCKPPQTWYAYIGKPGSHMSIIEMELNEMKMAYNNMRANPPTASHGDFVREIKHSIAALAYALDEMTCNEYPVASDAIDYKL